jgi:hypothetical protein
VLPLGCLLLCCCFVATARHHAKAVLVACVQPISLGINPNGTLLCKCLCGGKACCIWISACV